MVVVIGIRDEFRSGGLKSLARIFFPLIARKSSGFARILPDFFLPENGYLKNSRGAAAPFPISPMGRTPMVVVVVVVVVVVGWW